MSQPRVTAHYATCPGRIGADSTTDGTCHCPTAPASPLYYELDQLHGQVLRAKYRLTERPDRDVLAELVADLVYRAKLVETEWQAYEATQDDDSELSQP